MYKKFRVLKTGVFLHPRQQADAPVRNAVPVPIGAVFQLHRGSAQVKPWLHFKQVEPMPDDAVVTFDPDSNL